MTRPDDAYTDWQVHFEDCPHCRRDKPCPVGEEIQRREKRGGK